jgi:hypothetical protein
MPEPLLTTDTEESLESPTLARRTFDSIKADIIGGQLAQGTKIVESDLALKYGISRGRKTSIPRANHSKAWPLDWPQD